MKVLVYNLANVQCLNPFLFKDILIDYLQIGQIIMSNVEWFSERVVKSSIIALLKVLRCYHYYCDPDKFGLTMHSPTKLRNYNEIQAECNKLYYQIFDEKNIEKYFNNFILKVFPYSRNIVSQNDLDSQVENGN